MAKACNGWQWLCGDIRQLFFTSVVVESFDRLMSFNWFHTNLI